MGGARIFQGENDMKKSIKEIKLVQDWNVMHPVGIEVIVKTMEQSRGQRPVLVHTCWAHPGIIQGIRL
jgi:hypothetical protein